MVRTSSSSRPRQTLTAMFFRINNIHNQHARFGFSEDPSKKPRHLVRVWLHDTELAPEMPADIQNKFDAMFAVEPHLVPLDEIEEDEIRRQTGVFTGSCEKDHADDRIKQGGILAADKQA